MSKVQLKKELLTMNKEELINLILDTYTARKEAQDYLEFFLNPDVNALKEKYKVNITKEFNRVKRGSYSKARISLIRKMLKEFASYAPGFQAELDLLQYTINVAIISERDLYFPETLIKGVSSLIEQLLDIADRNYVFDITLQELREVITTSKLGISKSFSNYLNKELNTYISGIHLQHEG
jgi:hypothetical protein